MLTKTSTLQGISRIKGIHWGSLSMGGMEITFEELVELYPWIPTGKAAPYIDSEGITHKYLQYFYCDKLEISFENTPSINGFWSVTLSWGDGFDVILEFMYPRQRMYFLAVNWQFLNVTTQVRWVGNCL